jgi:hypothetical protein
MTLWFCSLTMSIEKVSFGALFEETVKLGEDSKEVIFWDSVN